MFILLCDFCEALIFGSLFQTKFCLKYDLLRFSNFIKISGLWILFGSIARENVCRQIDIETSGPIEPHAVPPARRAAGWMHVQVWQGTWGGFLIWWVNVILVILKLASDSYKPRLKERACEWHSRLNFAHQVEKMAVWPLPYLAVCCMDRSCNWSLWSHSQRFVVSQPEVCGLTARVFWSHSQSVLVSQSEVCGLAASRVLWSQSQSVLVSQPEVVVYIKIQDVNTETNTYIDRTIVDMCNTSTCVTLIRTSLNNLFHGLSSCSKCSPWGYIRAFATGDGQ